MASVAPAARVRRSLQPGDRRGRVDGVAPPAHLPFGECFNLAIDGVVWLVTLQQLTFGTLFDQPIDGVYWPASLKQLTFGACCNQAIDGVVWPASLQQLTFGDNFNQAIDQVVWPASLQQLTFGIASTRQSTWSCGRRRSSSCSLEYSLIRPSTGSTSPRRSCR